MKIGIDIHGTIDERPDFFRKFIHRLRRNGVEIHITTGRPGNYARNELARLEIEYDYIFSITDYHLSIGTDMTWDKNGDPWIDDELWDSSKGKYCERYKIDLHIDDSQIYGKYFKTPYMQYKMENLYKGVKENGQKN